MERSQKKDNTERNYEIFLLFSKIELELDKENLEKNYERLSKVTKLFSTRSSFKKDLKFILNNIYSIKGAINRIEENILLKDLDKCKEKLEEQFNLFKLETGIKEIKKEKKRKPRVITLEDLGRLEEIKKELFTFDKVTDNKDFLENMKEYLESLIKEKEYTYFKIPLFVNGYVQFYKKLKNYDIEIENSDYGTLWKNCLVFASNKEIPLIDIKNYLKEELNESFEILYRPKKHPLFKNWYFYWVFNKKMLLEIGRNKIENWDLPLPSIKKEFSKEEIEGLKNKRLNKNNG